MPERLGRAGRGLVTGLLAAALVALAAVALARATGHAVMVDRSDSMKPAISAGDLVVARAVRPADVGPGDVVTFADPERPGRTITHRVVARRPAGNAFAFVTQGDANTGQERWSVPATGTLGRLRLVIPHAGRAVALMGEPWLRLALMCVLTTVLGAVALYRIWI